MNPKWIAVTPALILFLLLLAPVCFAGLFGGDTTIIIKKPSGGDSNLSFTGGNLQEFCYWDSNKNIKPTTTIIGADTFSVAFDKNIGQLAINNADINLYNDADNFSTNLSNYALKFKADQVPFGLSYFGMGVDNLQGDFEFLAYLEKHNFIFRDANLLLEKDKCLYFDKYVTPYSICDEGDTLVFNQPAGGQAVFKGDYYDFSQASAIALPYIDSAVVNYNDINGLHLNQNGYEVCDKSGNCPFGGIDTNLYTAGILRTDNNAVAIDLNLQKTQSIYGAKDLNAYNLTLFNSTDNNKMIYSSVDSSTSTSLFITNQGRPTGMGGISMRTDPLYAAGQGLYVLGNTYGSGGRIYFACLTAAGALTPCYSMDFTNVTNWAGVPKRITQIDAVDTAYCPSTTCHSIGADAGSMVFNTGSTGFLGGAMFATGTGASPAVKWKSYLSNASQASWKSGASNSLYRYDTNSPIADINGLNHSIWQTVGVTKMSLTPDGNLAVVGDINTATKFIAKNQIGIDKNVTVMKTALTTCDINIVGGIIIASTC